MEPKVRVDVPMEDGARVAAFVYAPAGVADASGTPFAVAYEPAPVVVLHGNGESHGHMAAVVEQLAARRSVIAVDSRGHGASVRGSDPISYELMAADTFEVMSRLGVTQAHVLGFSDGGITALLMARQMPARVLSLVTLGANLSPEGLDDDAREGMCAALEGLTQGPGVWYEMREDGVARCISEYDASGAEPICCEAAGEPARYGEDELLRLMLTQPQIDPVSLAAVRCPVCVMAGEHDLIKAEETERIAAAIPGARKVVVPACGHDLPAEAPDVVVRAACETMTRAESARPVRPLVSFDGGAPRVLDPAPGIYVRRATPADEHEVLALYERLMDACDEPGRETCGWKRGYWPLPNDVSARLHAGTTWVAVAGEGAGACVGKGAQDLAGANAGVGAGVGTSDDAAAGVVIGAGAGDGTCAMGRGDRIVGAMSLDHDFGLPGVDPGWEPLPLEQALTCHILAVDPDERGRGIATALLCAYAREGLARGCRALRINTSPQSLSNRLYHELGFVLHRPVWFPYEGLPLTPWTNLYELRLDGEENW